MPPMTEIRELLLVMSLCVLAMIAGGIAGYEVRRFVERLERLDGDNDSEGR